MHSKNAASIIVECNCRREMPLGGRGRDVDSPPSSSLWSRFRRLLKFRCSALSSCLSIGLLVGVENLFGCSRAGRFTQLDGFVATLRPDVSNIKTLFLPQGPFFTLPPTSHCIQISRLQQPFFTPLTYFRSWPNFYPLANRCRLSRSFLHLVAIHCLHPPFNLVHMRLRRCFQLFQIAWW